MEYFQLSEFQIPSVKDWRRYVSEELKGENPANLIYPTFNGFSTDPVYFKDENSYGAIDPGSSCRQVVEILVGDEENTNFKALEALNNGAEGVIFVLDRNWPCNFEKVLKGIETSYCGVGLKLLDFSDFSPEKFLIELEKGGKISEGWINIDLPDFAARTGQFKIDWLEKIVEYYKKSASLNLRSLVINTHSFHNRGASQIQEIAFSLSYLVECAEFFKEKGINSADLVTKTLFSVTVGTELFFEIAKLRALRILISKIAEAYQVPLNPGEIIIQTETSIWNKSAIEQDLNIIRNTLEAFAAVTGGSNYITVHPHEIFDSGSSFSNRVSRNIPNLLIEEAFISKVKDVAAGSYFIEDLTEKMVKSSWDLFLKVEEKGGFIKTFNEGWIGEEILMVKKSRLEKLKKGEEVLVGVNAYKSTGSATEFNTINSWSQFWNRERAAFEFEQEQLKQIK